MKRSRIVLMMVFFVVLLVAGCGKDKEGAADKEEGVAPKASMPQEFSATIVSTSAGQTVTSHVYMKKDKFRTDTKMAGSSTIVRKDINKVWMIMTAQKAYMEMPGVTEEQTQTVEEKVKGEMSRKKIGNETIDGHPATKYEVTAKVGDNVSQIYQWWATDINFPVKTAAVDGSWSMEYKDIKTGGQPDSLFEIPSGYKKMTVPGMPGGMNIKIPGMGAK
jgi:hypothetical protein